MEYYEEIKATQALRIEYFPDAAKVFGKGFPDAIKVFSLSGEKSKKFAHFALHQSDLNFAFECLEAINKVSDEPFVLRQALWRSALVHFFKCFGKSKSRDQLSSKQIYGEGTQAYEVFTHFKSLRDKHIVHDENSYSQCMPGAILNKKSSDRKIAKIVFVSVFGNTLNQENYNNFHVLVTRAQKWVEVQFDSTANEITSELEPKQYDELLARDGITTTEIVHGDVHNKRA